MIALRLGLFLALALLLGSCTSKSSGNTTAFAAGRFTEVSAAAGMSYTHGFQRNRGRVQRVTGGVACGDYDKDGFLDIYVITGDVQGNQLYHNKGDGTFEEVAKAAGVDVLGGAWCGALFVDFNGDGYLDLFLGGVTDTQPCLLVNKKDGTFADVTPNSGLDQVKSDAVSAAWGDYDRDGDLDLFLTQWNTKRTNLEDSQHLWQNDGSGKFTDVSRKAGVTLAFDPNSTGFTDLSFTPNFTDINGDGWLDLLITGDLGSNLVLINKAKGAERVFENATTPVLRSEHASGAAIGDYDNDGDLDWFVAGVYHPNGSSAGPLTGNRLYKNKGDGTFDDVTDLAGVRYGGWGWASSFADLDNDGSLDLVQVNGFGTTPSDVFKEFLDDPTRVYMSNGDGSFQERSAALGLVDQQQGRGVVCFDFDRDGDLDIFTATMLGGPRLWRNDLANNGSYLSVALTFKTGNPRAIGAKVKITVGGESQIREIRAGCHYVSQNPAEAHFGLGGATTVDAVEITWPDGSKTTQANVPANQLLKIRK